MNPFRLTIIAGDVAKERLQRDGWTPDIFNALIGASGGAKLLGITHLDRYLVEHFLPKGDKPLCLYGSSIGSWRHAAFAPPDPLASLTTLQDRYLNQGWDENEKRSPTEVVDELCEWVLDGFIDDALVNHLVAHPRYTSHIVTARGKGLNNRKADPLLALGMGASAIGNLFSRNMLATSFQRIVFSSGDSSTMVFDDFDTAHITLKPENVRSALTASGSIPFLMSGVQDITDAPAGQYWDGGVIDYHFDFRNQRTDSLALYPHFGADVIKGWFDKKLPWRRNSRQLLSRVVVVAPSATYLASLPGGKVPDRKDFPRYSQPERIQLWQQAMDQSKLLAEALDEVVGDPDPLRYVS